MRAKIYLCPRNKCLICLESPFIMNQCLECSYNMCSGCLKKYLEYNYNQCPQCRVLITTNSPVNQNRSSSSISPSSNQSQNKCLLINKYFSESNKKFFCNLIIIFGTIIGCYYIGYSIDKNHHFIVSIFLGFLISVNINVLPFLVNITDFLFRNLIVFVIIVFIIFKLFN